jgi:hypothetical protein
VNNLSAKAYAFLVAIYQHNLSISANSMMTHFKVGRRAALSGLKELRSNEFISTNRQRIGNKIMTVSALTEKGERLLFGVVTSYFVESHNVTPDTSNEHISRNTISTVISKNHVLTESRKNSKTINIEVNDMSWGGIYESAPSSDDDLKSELIKDRERKRAEAKEAKEKQKEDFKKVKKEVQGERKTYREREPKSQWRVKDVCFEFSDRIQQHFHIAPWEVANSKFSGALGGFRNHHNTNGEIEVAAMDIFFRQLNINEYKDAESIWRLFISRLPVLVGMVKMATPTEEVTKASQVAHEKALRELRRDV